MQNYGGISRYFCELLKYSESSNIDMTCSVKVSSNEYLAESTKFNYIPKPNVKLKGKERFLKYISESYTRSRLRNIDVFHPTFYETYHLNKLKKLNIPYVITVYDMINELYPEYFSTTDDVPLKKKKLIENADRIIAISENTKNDIVKFYNIDPEKIDITYLASDLSLEIEKSPDQKLPEKYLLFVGKRGGYKNFYEMYQQIKEIIQDTDYHLVCAGGGRFNTNELELFKSDKTLKKMHYVDIKSNQILKFLYMHATLFLFPSLYEGFGIPVIEAMSNRCPVILSNRGSFPEVGGDAGLYFEPEEENSIRSVVDKLLSNDGLYNSKKSDSFKNATKFSWKHTFDQTVEIYKKTVN